MVMAMYWRILVSVFVGLFLGGCASQSGSTQKVGLDKAQTPEQKVLGRVQARWDVLLAKDLDKAYEFLSPATRSTVSKDVYKSRINPSFWRGAKAKSASCREEVCDVKVELNVMVLENLPVDQMIEEKWILAEGQWWFVYQG